MNRIIYVAVGMLAFACSSTASQAALTSFTVDSATISKSTGAITVTGTILCTAGDGFLIENNIAQVSGGKSGLTEDTTMGTCSGGTDTWTAPQLLAFGAIINQYISF